MSSVSVYTKGKCSHFDFSQGEVLLEILRRNGLEVAAPCGGNGSCGKCLVRVVRGGAEETVLACRTPAENNMRVFLPDDGPGLINTELRMTTHGGGRGLGAALDIGTTTVVLALFDLESGEKLAAVSGWNSQKSYGADVVSRAQYCIEHSGGLETLSELIRRQTEKLLRDACRAAGRKRDEVTEIFAAGNTVMQHIFAGLSPEKIVRAPFIPDELFDGRQDFSLGSTPLRFAPCVSGFVGGDITAGLLAAGAADEEKTVLFLDVGTNGEMALGGKDGLSCCAAASGPAFEGAGISCGMQAKQGAVSAFRWAGAEPELEVIGGGKPRGLCASGLVDLIAALLDKGIIDGSGYLCPPENVPGFGRRLRRDENGNGCFFITEDVYLTAADVRALQLAKGALRAGAEVLIRQAGMCHDGISRVYLAGGLGCAINVESAVRIGLIAPELRDKTISIGNAALSGTAMALTRPEARKKLCGIRDICSYIELSGNADFSSLFPEYMTFEE